MFANVSAGADKKTNYSRGGGALERRHGTPLEALAQLGDALGSVGTASIAIVVSVDAAEHVISQAAREGMSVNGR